MGTEVGRLEIARAAAYVGFALYVVTVVLFRPNPSPLWALVPGIISSIPDGASDLRAEMLTDQVPRWLTSMKDIVNTNLIPFILVLASRLREPESKAFRLSPRAPSFGLKRRSGRGLGCVRGRSVDSEEH